MPSRLTMLAALTLPSAAIAQTAPADLKDYGLVCFCSSRVATPHFVVGLDNNGRILSLLRKPMTKAEIVAAGEPVLDSQLRLLRDWGLVKRNGDTYQVGIPVLGPVEMAALRARLAPAADRVARQSAPDVAQIAAELERRGRSASAQAVLFGYVLDGLVWRELERRGRLPSQEITVHRPYWAGTFWAVYPKQDHMPGTNELSNGNASLRMMWTPAVVHHFPTLVNDAALKAWLEAAGRAPPGAPRPTLPEGSPLREAVIVDERTADPLFTHGKAIAHRAAEAIVNQRLDEVIPNADESQRLLIATHEFIWMLLDRARAANAIGEPQTARKSFAQLGEIGPMLVVVIRDDTP